jgi:hypothetical protein
MVLFAANGDPPDSWEGGPLDALSNDIRASDARILLWIPFHRDAHPVHNSISHLQYWPRNSRNPFNRVKPSPDSDDTNLRRSPIQRDEEMHLD